MLISKHSVFWKLVWTHGKRRKLLVQTKMSLSEKQHILVLWHKSIYVMFICWINSIMDKIEFLLEFFFLRILEFLIIKKKFINLTDKNCRTISFCFNIAEYSPVNSIVNTIKSLITDLKRSWSNVLILSRTVLLF